MEYLERDRRAGPPESAHSELTRLERLPRLGAIRDGAVPAVVAILLLVTWEVGVRAGVIDALLFTPPTVIGAALVELFSNGVLGAHLAATAWRVGVAVAMGGGAGLLLGVAMGSSARMRRAVDPFVAALHPIPKIAILPLIMVIFGIGDVSLVIVIATGAFFPILINTMAGVAQIHPVHHDVAQLYGASRLMRFRRVVLPGSAPAILAGFRLALNTALLIAIAVEIVAARVGLGAMIWLSWTTLRTEEIYVAIAVTIAFGLAVNAAISLTTKLAVPWQATGKG